MTKRIIKFFAFLLAALVLFYIAYQAYAMLYPSYKTKVAYISAVEDTIPATGIVVRNETVIDSSSEGIINYLVNNGDKVAQGSSVAEVYESAHTALDALTLELLQAELESLERSAGYGRTSGTNINSLTERAYRLLQEISIGSARGDYSMLNSQRLALLELLNSIAATSGQEVNAEARIAEIKSQIAALSGVSTPLSRITTPYEGYFISDIDGYEDAVNKETILDMPVSDILALTNGEGILAVGSGCKIVSDYVWNYAAVIDSKYADRFVPGLRLTLDFNYASVTELPVRVVDVRVDAALGKMVVILECRQLNVEIANLRCEEAQLSFRNYSGFIVERSALRMEDGVVGVYVKYGSVIEFRRLNIVYETADYIVSAPDSSDSGLLALYDEIIVAGTDLYVGKDLR